MDIKLDEQKMLVLRKDLIDYLMNIVIYEKQYHQEEFG